VNDQKYIVFKREELRARFGHSQRLNELELEDAVVIRTQDVFARSGLMAYANTIYAHVTLLHELYEHGELPPNAAAMIDRLFEIANYFHQRADEAEGRVAAGQVKVPD